MLVVTLPISFKKASELIIQNTLWFLHSNAATGKGHNMCALSAVPCTHQSYDISVHLGYTGYTTLRANKTEKMLV